MAEEAERDPQQRRQGRGVFNGTVGTITALSIPERQAEIVSVRG
jgi:hypothetical protein